VLQNLIAGVRVRAVRHVPKSNGVLTEIYRSDWKLDDLDVAQVFQTELLPGAISGWHVHQHTTDRLFVTRGLMKIVLYDAREDSPTHGRINEFRHGTHRPALVLIPPGVWHAVQNYAAEPGALVNLVDRAYAYDDPDHWRLPLGTRLIPYSFQAAQTSNARYGDAI
jgi:dTDP-4-dehydrorhamnose 3,5-epimerase